MLTDAQTSPRSVSGDLLDVEIRGVCRQSLESVLNPLAGWTVQALQVFDRAGSQLDVAQRTRHL